MKPWLFVFAIAGAVAGGCSDEPTRAELELDEDEPLQQVSSGRGGGALGAACTTNADCQGTNARCLTTIPVVGITFPDGFCTSTCKTNAQCGSSGACPLGPLVDLARTFLPDAGATVAELSTCFLKCTTQADCRSGYTCAAPPPSPLAPTAASSVKYCQPPMPDGGLRLPDGGLSGAGGFPGLGGIPGLTPSRDAGSSAPRDAGRR